MKLNIGSLAFNADISQGGGTPAWGTELGQGENYKFSITDGDPLFTAMVYCSISNKFEKITCPLGKGGGRQMDYDFVLASLFEKVFVNGTFVPDAKFLLLIVKQIAGEHHIGRRVLKYNPRMTYNGIAVNEDCYIKIAHALDIAPNAAWFIDEINTHNQDELHFTAYVLDSEKPKMYANVTERKEDFKSKMTGNEARFIKAKERRLNICKMFRPYLTAIKSKPFLLLAGISGTGKSRIVRELARACWDEGSAEFEAQKPKNFEMVQVKPNWHDSSELIGYVSRVSGKAEFIAGEFLKFIARAWEDTDTPYFLCLDEMNLAPVEQYFAEYLSVIESRKSHEDGSVTTDPILEKIDEEWYFNLTASLTLNEEIRKKFNEEGICIPQNLIVIGTVNMDETTFSFSRKVLDRAMTIEMNEVDLDAGLTERYEHIGKLGYEELIGTIVEGVDVYSDNREVCDKALIYLKAVNAVLEGTPFKVAYRTRNEFLLYVVNNLPYNKDAENNELPQDYVIARALDEITSMKILSRIEGDDSKVSDGFLTNLSDIIEENLSNISSERPLEVSISLSKIKEMRNRLSSGYTSFWS